MTKVFRKCQTCKFHHLPCDEGPCALCDNMYSNWTMRDMREEVCFTCKHEGVLSREEPCCSCGSGRGEDENAFSRWEPLVEELIKEKSRAKCAADGLFGEARWRMA